VYGFPSTTGKKKNLKIKIDKSRKKEKTNAYKKL